jgi:hypothetical protein
MARLAALTTHSLPALKHFLRGETEFRRGNYTEAFEAFRLATAEDSTFALAHFRLAHAANWAVPERLDVGLAHGPEPRPARIRGPALAAAEAARAGLLRVADRRTRRGRARLPRGYARLSR